MEDQIRPNNGAAQVVSLAGAGLLHHVRTEGCTAQETFLSIQDENWVTQQGVVEDSSPGLFPSEVNDAPFCGFLAPWSSRLLAVVAQTLCLLLWFPRLHPEGARTCNPDEAPDTYLS